MAKKILYAPNRTGFVLKRDDECSFFFYISLMMKNKENGTHPTRVTVNINENLVLYKVVWPLR